MSCFMAAFRICQPLNVVFPKELPRSAAVFVNDLPHVLKRACMEIYEDHTTMYVSAENSVCINYL